MTEIQGSDPARSIELVCPEKLEVRADERLVRIVLENLLQNAWKFSSKKPSARIEVGTMQGADGATFFVKDDGAGFDSTRTENVFAPFQRLHSKDDYDGTGIGLAIVQRIIHHHRGKIWAEAKPDQGATFFFTLA